MDLSVIKDNLAIESETKSFTKGEVLEILKEYEDAILSKIDEFKRTSESDYKYLSENNGSEFELGSANGAFWALAELRGWIEDQ